MGIPDKDRERKEIGRREDGGGMVGWWAGYSEWRQT